MIPEPTNARFDAIEKYLAKLQADYDAMKRWLDHEKPGWDKEPAEGASGTMTGNDQSIEGYITPKDHPVNMRTAPSRVGDNIAYQLAIGGVRKVIGRITDYNGEPYMWYITDDEKYAREDVVIFTEKEPITPINAALWPAPVTGYSIESHHGDSHDGLDLACPMGTVVRCGPNGGEVAKLFVCGTCNPYGDGARSLDDPDKGWGYGNFVIVRYAYAILPKTIQSRIPQGAYLFAIHAHLSMIPTVLKKGMTLDPYQKIGEVGSTGYSSGPHLHYALHWAMSASADFYGIRMNAIDPKLLIKA